MKPEFLAAISALLLAQGDTLSASDAVPVSGIRAVSGTRLCKGGNGDGTFVQIDVSACSAVPCILYVGSSYEFALTFKPSVTTGNLYFSFQYYIGGEESYSKAFIPGNFVAGQQYRVSRTVEVPSRWQGKRGHIAPCAHVGSATTFPGQLCRMVDVEIARARLNSTSQIDTNAK